MSDLVPVAEAAALESSSGSIAALHNARLLIANAEPGDLAKMIIWADAIDAAARVQSSYEIAREAVETRARAERRLGEILASDEERLAEVEVWGRRDFGISGSGLADLGRLPKRIFEETLADMLSRNLQCEPTALVRNADRRSLKRYEYGIYRAWNGVFFAETKPGYRKRVGTLDAARAAIARRKNPQLARLDEAFGRARALAQEISRLGEKLRLGEGRELVAEAELAQAKVAELLYAAHLAYEASDG